MTVESGRFPCKSHLWSETDPTCRLVICVSCGARVGATEPGENFKELVSGGMIEPRPEPRRKRKAA